MRRSHRILAATFLAFATATAACTSDGEKSSGGDPTPSTIDIGTPGIDTQLISALAAFDSCDAFLDHMKTNALEVVGPWGLNNGWFGGPFMAVDDVAMDAAASGEATGAPFAESATETTAARQEGVDFSGTNIQEAGVDEPDLVKTDGSRMLVIADGTLHLLDVTGDVPVLLDSLELPAETWVSEMLFDGDRVLLLASASQYEVMPMADVRIGIVPTGSPISTLIEVDIEGTQLTTSRRLHLDGAQLSSRLIDGVARVVVQSGPVGFEWNYPEYGGDGLEAQRDNENAEQVAQEANRELIRNSTEANWLPYFVLEDGSGTVIEEGTLVDCNRAYHPTDFSGLNMLNVVTIDLRGGGLAAPDAVSVLADGQTVYASTQSLYVATTEWIDWSQYYDDRGEQIGEPPRTSTAIHRFDISDPTRTDYVASGSVPGTVLNQYSLSEHDGRLRIATTHDGMFWSDGDTSSSSLYVLETVEGQDGAELDVVGQIDDLGKGERIFAVRFMGDLATVVTFRQTDPLYTIDLSNPTAPVLLGELKINGYSAYLHPLGDGLLLGVGQDATDDGRTTGTQVSLFDISDRANPTRIAQWTLDGSYSDTEWDARAFLWWPAEQLVVLPVSSYGWNAESEQDESFFGAIGLRVSDGTITELGRVTMQEPTRMRECYGPEGWSVERIYDDGRTELVEAYDQNGRPVDEPVVGATSAGATGGSADGTDAPPADEAAAAEEPPAAETEPRLPDEEPPISDCYTWIESDWRAQIQRTVVVGDQLHAVAQKGILTVELGSFEETGRVEFPTRQF
ncbi:MAG: beta-propeller domain-containing protein [Acidimicrobiales bacterium]|nr:beta-propeller domain-containing protein [Acidimicrobiales bacterium]